MDKGVCDDPLERQPAVQRELEMPIGCFNLDAHCWS